MLRVPLHASRRELAGDCLDPRELAPFSEEQRREPGFPFARFEDDEQIAWVSAFSFSDERPLWVPAEAVYLGAHCRHVHMVGTSSGLAAGPTLEEALAGAIYELIERDAFMITWAGRRTPPEIDLDRCTYPEVGELRRRAAGGRVELRAFDLTTDVAVPTFLGVAIAAGGRVPSLAVGAASRLSGRAAIAKALLEALHTWNWTFELLAARGELTGPAAEPDLAIRDFADLVYLYAHPWRRQALDFILRPRERVLPEEDEAPASTPAEEVERVLAALGRAGCRVLAADLGPDPEWDMRFRVVRALSPDLVPLSLAGHRSYWGCRRYFTVPRRLGDAAPPETGGDLNREPHPFP
jgi:ribosomal protein S12 methylthiotransferase accessory factor